MTKIYYVSKWVLRGPTAWTSMTRWEGQLPVYETTDRITIKLYFALGEKIELLGELDICFTDDEDAKIREFLRGDATFADNTYEIHPL